MAKNVLELNGKRYDAITGAYLGVSSTAAAVAAPVKKAKKPAGSASKGRVVDGFIRPKVTAIVSAKPKPAAKPKKVQAAAEAIPVTVKPKAKPAHTPAPAAKAVHTKPKTIVARPAGVKPKPVIKKVADVPRPKPKASPTSSAVHIPITTKPHQPQKAKTLMRRAVHKPNVSIKPAIKPQAPAEIAPRPISAITLKPSALHVDEERLARAQHVHKFKGIRHFQPVRPDYTPEAIETTPRPEAPIVPAIAVQAAPPAITPGQHTEGDIFEAALARAESHKQPKHQPHKRPRAHRRLVNTMAGVAALLVIGGFITYLNMPNIQLHVASIQAGFTADMPGYKPTGYALQGGVQRIGNTVSMRFTSGEHNYTVTQQPSAWNSQTLIDNTVALSDGAYKTVQAGGRNVYVYGDNNAVWVDRGVRYDLTVNAPLTTDDISQLAASL